MSTNIATQDPDTLDLLPWNWTVTSLDPQASPCPSESSILATFAAVNGVVSLLALILGHQKVVKRLSCGILTGEGRPWLGMWIVPLGLQLAANAAIAAVIKGNTNYAADFAVWEFMLFLAARPRLSWIVLGALSFCSSRMRSEYDGYHDTYFPWWSAFMSQFIAEIVLQIMAVYVMGLTANFAAARGYYKVFDTELYSSLPPGAHLMYAGALYYLIVGSIFLIAAVSFVFYAIAWTKDSQEAKARTRRIVIAIVTLLISTWMGSWLFWVGFVLTAGDL